ncbi:Tigger transposable element-derived protein 1 [Danaus plexippus plexippus]|uniref:Tigger transposable element-derived protein 1 n=1 Tax=Danaus plexippus plexippus TaxID=278856 RepID=A0A212FEA6_DANPL|nr:Tigger transposable element-derived protein 1 [Danaus plexippus plexippus]
MAGRYWLEFFLKRNLDLSFRKPEATSAARASGFNPVAVNKFYELLTDLIIKYKLTADKIFNVDETGITTVPKSLPRIVGTKGKKQVGLLTSAERGQLVTVVFCMGADGSYMPPLFIFPRKRMKEELMRNAPRGSWLCVTKVDGRDHGVHILSFPPHCTHRLQPLDVGFMKPLSTYYTEAANNWLKMNGGKIITQFQIPELVNQAFQKTATLTTAYNSYENTGIWPLNRNRFTEADFLAASTTDIALNDSVTDNETLIVNNNYLQLSIPSVVSHASTSNLQDSVNDEPQPSTSGAVQSSSINYQPQNQPSVTNLQEETSSESQTPGSSKTHAEKKTPKIIMPFPKTTATKRKSVRRGKTAVITSSPYRKELDVTPIINNKKSVKTNLNLETKKKANKGNTTKKIKERKKQRNRKDSTTDEENDDTKCFYYYHLYSESNEGWVRCQTCHQWAHCSCAGVEDDDADTIFICENCSNLETKEKG